MIQTDRRKWDYKYQVLATPYLPPWRVLLWVKFIEAVMQGRPRALARVMAHADSSIRAAMQWYYRIGRRMWPFELWEFVVGERRANAGPTLAEFWGDAGEGAGPGRKSADEHRSLDADSAQEHAALIQADREIIASPQSGRQRLPSCDA